MRLEEGLLDGVLGIGGRSRDQVGGSEGDVIVPLDQQFVRLGIPGATARRELMVFQWTALHGVRLSLVHLT
jgi:hypothetical protein